MPVGSESALRGVGAELLVVPEEQPAVELASPLVEHPPSLLSPRLSHVRRSQSRLQSHQQHNTRCVLTSERNRGRFSLSGSS